MYYDKLISRIDDLNKLGEQVLSTRHPPPPNISGNDRVNGAPFHKWRASCLSFLSSVFGETHTHFTLFQNECRNTYYFSASAGHQIMLAAKDDIVGGYLKSLETFVSADIFTNFLDMSEYLSNEGYINPAASLSGAVLEDGLRKISNSKNVKLKQKENISSLNQKLFQAKIYNQLAFSNIRVWNTIRDNADHGNFSEYNADDVNKMIAGIRSFLNKYL
jgi:hypothetical protein